MIVVRSEDGCFLGEVRDVRVIEYEGWHLVANHQRFSNGKEVWELLATYKTQEAVIKQIDDMQRYLAVAGKAQLDNLVHYDRPELTNVLVPVYDLRERKIED